MRSRPVQRNGQGTMFGQLNAGKRSIVLDLKKPEAIAAVKKLVAKVDIVLENYRPGVMKRLGLDYAELAKINPAARLWRDLGLRPDRPRRRPPGLCAGDPCLDRLRHGASLLPAGPRAAGQLRHLRRRLRLAAPMRWARILAALHQRDATGKGQMVDVSMFETLVGMLLGEVNRAQFDFEMPSRPMYGPVEARTATSCWRPRASGPSRTWRPPPAGATG